VLHVQFWENAVKVFTIYVTFFANIGPTYVIYIPLPSVQLVDCRYLIMVALHNRAHQYIFALWFLSSLFFFLFFPRLISAAVHWMSTILPHMVWP